MSNAEATPNHRIVCFVFAGRETASARSKELEEGEAFKTHRVSASAVVEIDQQSRLYFVIDHGNPKGLALAPYKNRAVCWRPEPGVHAAKPWSRHRPGFDGVKPHNTINVHREGTGAKRCPGVRTSHRAAMARG